MQDGNIVRSLKVTKLMVESDYFAQKKSLQYNYMEVSST